ncbi:hypothetical protein FRAAL1711 [Frankia alni ACN14a]|uniref:Uncharacterized protein n=1 Tax=Frankia alni (strain DSM 45986 / CECT 9034 / ACN14a) TaxID=326424 RepID=Q0RQ13_FRAAA|nr:hypothetical protein FRAAL1711 [Frankia alni ACN14a]
MGSPDRLAPKRTRVLVDVAVPCNGCPEWA